MKKQMFITLVVAAMLLLPLSSAMAIYNMPTEMLKWDPDKAQNGYNLFNTAGKAWLLDMEGQIVNEWDPATDMVFGMYSFLMENGRLRTAGNPSGMPGRGSVTGAGGSQGRIEEYDWDGNRTWYMDVFDGVADITDGTYTFDATHSYRMHHDYQHIYNAELGKWTYMILIWVVKGETDADNLGVDPALNGPSRADAAEGTWSPCALIEVDPDYASGEGGDVIWYWTFADHMVTTDPGGTAATAEWTDWAGRTSRPPTVVSSTTGATDSIQAHPELLDVNGMHYTEPDGPRIDYQHCNSFDYDERTGYVAINAKASNEFFVLDHDGTFDATATANDWSDVGALARGAGGDFLYRWGNPGNYYSGEPASFYDEGDMEMYGTHDIQFIWDYHWRAPMAAGDTWAAPPASMALPGTGNFLLFDNGCYNPTNGGSRVIEVNPYLLGDGSEETATYADGNTMFVDPGPDALANTTGLKRRSQVVWLHGSGAPGINGQRSINNFYSNYISGNTRMPNGNTIIDAGSFSHFFEVTEDNEVVWEYVVPPQSGTEFQGVRPEAGGTFRFHRFLSSHPALLGKDLTPGSTLTGRVPAEVGTVVEAPAAAPAPPAPTGWGTSGLSAGEGGGGSAGGTGTGGSSGAY